MINVNLIKNYTLYGIKINKFKTIRTTLNCSFIYN